MTFAGAQIDGSVVVVTGGGTGIGAAIAERFAAEGAHVVITGRRKATLDDVATQIGALAIVPRGLLIEVLQLLTKKTRLF